MAFEDFLKKYGGGTQSTASTTNSSSENFETYLKNSYNSNFTDYLNGKYKTSATTTNKIPKVENTVSTNNVLKNTTNKISGFTTRNVTAENKLDGNSILNKYGKSASDFSGTSLYDVTKSIVAGLNPTTWFNKEKQSEMSKNLKGTISKYKSVLDNAKDVETFAKENNFSNEELKAVKRAVADANNESEDKKLAEDTNKNLYTKYAGTILSAPMRAAESITNVANTLGSAITGKGTRNVPMLDTSTDIRNSVSKDMNGAGQFLYGTANSLADMGLNSVTGLGAIGMGVEKASDTIKDAQSRRLSDNKILAEALASGVATGLSEAIPFGYWSKIAKNGVTENSLKEVAKTIVTSALAEGSQEVAEDAFDTFFDNMIAGRRSKIYQSIKDYMRNDKLTKEEATKQAYTDWLKDTALDFAGGALFGGIMAGGSAIVGNSNVKARENAQGFTGEENAMFEQNDLEKLRKNNEKLMEKRIAEEEQANKQTALVELLEQARLEDERQATLEEERRATTAPNLTDLLGQASKISNAQTDVSLQADMRQIMLDNVTQYAQNLDTNDTNIVNSVISSINNYFDTGKLSSLQTAFVLAAQKMNNTNVGNNIATYLSEEITNQMNNAKSPYAMGVAKETKVNPLSDYGIVENLRTKPNYKTDTFENFLLNAYKGAESTQTSEQTTNVKVPSVMAEDVGILNTDNALEPLTNEVTAIPKNEVSTEKANTFDNTYKGNVLQTTQTADNSYAKSAIFGKSKESAKWLKENKSEFAEDVKHWNDVNEEAVRKLNENREGVIKDIMSTNEVSALQVSEGVYLMNDLINEAIQNGDWTSVKNFSKRLNSKIHNAAQSLNILAQYGNTFEGTVLKTDSLAEHDTKVWEKNAEKSAKGRKQLNENKTFANALSLIDNAETDVATKAKIEKTHEQIRREVVNTINKNQDTEIANILTTEDVDFLSRGIHQGLTESDIASLLNQKIATGNMGISDTDLKRVNELFTKADEKGTSSIERTKLMAQAYSILSEYTGNATFMDKWNAWRYLAMLGNTKTMIRNILGNTFFGAVTNFKDTLGGLLEEAYENSGNKIRRTKSVLTPADSNLVNSAKEDFDLNVYEEASRGGSKYDMKSEIEGVKKIFENKYLEKYRTLASDILEKSDIYAIKQKYAKTLARYLKANKKSADILNSTNEADVAFMNKARAYALEQANIATFHEENKFASMLNKHSKDFAESGSVVGKAASFAIESTMPFKKTPANILKQGVWEYSPAQFINLANNVKNQADANEYINTISKGATGTMLLGLGAYLMSRGLVSSQPEDEDDPYNKAEDFALTIGDNAYTIDWLAPATMPLFVGAELYNALEDENAETSFIDVLGAITEPVVETSMLSGLKSVLTSLASGFSSKNELASLVANIGAGYVSQAVPTVLGQIARTVDPIRRTSSAEVSSSASPVKATLQKALNKIENKIPFLSMTNEPYLSQWGETEENAGGGYLGRLLYNTLSPGYYSNTSLSDREKGLAELEKSYQGSGTLIPKTYNERSIDGVRLTDEEYTTYSKLEGQYTAEAVDTALSYKGQVDDETLGNVTKEMEKLANAIAKSELFNYDIENSSTYGKTYSIYKDSGFDGVAQYYIRKNALTESGLSNSEKNVSVYEQYGADEGISILQDIFKAKETSSSGVNLIPTLDSYDLTDTEKGNLLKMYASSSKTIKELGSEDVYNVYKSKAYAMDYNADGKINKYDYIQCLYAMGLDTTKIEELIPYLN